jgi:hypothetical protein
VPSRLFFLKDKLNKNDRDAVVFICWLKRRGNPLKVPPALLFIRVYILFRQMVSDSLVAIDTGLAVGLCFHVAGIV